MVNISRLVKLLQSYSDAQEEDSNNMKGSLKNVHTRLDELIERIYSLEGHSGVMPRPRSPSRGNRAYESHDGGKFKDLEDKIRELERKM